jgi:4-hydroxy-tetrahydrodipicolinate synthase
VPGIDVFPSSEAVLGAADADGFAGCISATVNLTAAEAQAAWSGQGTAAGAAAATKAAELRAIVARHPLVAAVKAGLAARYGDPTWARPCLPLVALSAERAARLDQEFRQRAGRP